SNPVVTAIMEDRDERIWIGTYGGGINILTRDGTAPGGFRFSHLRSGKNGLASDFITSLFQDQSGNIWVGTHGAGLAQLRETDDGQISFLHYRFNPLKSNSISGDFVNTIYEDQYGQLWIGTNSGLNQLDRLTRRFTRYRHNANDPFSLSDNEIWAIYEDSYSQGRSLWIGTRNGGINKFDRQNYSFIRYNREFDNPHSLNNPAVLSIYEDSAGRLWFGTYSGGLNRFDHETQQFTFFTERDGLANNMIFGILEDRENNLWLSTNKGITKFSPQRKSFQNFDANDGLQADEFRAGAYYQTRRGEMLFGGINGVSMFYPDSVRMNPHLPGMQFTQFTVMGEDQTTILNQAAASDEPIELSYQQDIVSFEFAALDFNNPAKNRYAYKLEGLHDDWIDNGNRRFVSFPNLPSGSYVLRVKGSNNDGVWNESGISVKLIVTPPFWQRWWFIALAIIFASAATLA
ncbi:MAG: histidine kinase, partial [Calditrichaeota bacterium]|nr:histidine kinase [Calditrichota bacterium]